MSPTIRRHALFLAGFLLIAAFYAATIRPSHDWGGDFSVYVWHARNLASGQPYAATTFLVTPQSARNHPFSYPPLFPLLLAPLYAVAGLDFQLLKILPVALFLISLPLYYLLGLRLALSRTASACCVFVFAFSALALSLKDSLLADSTYLVASAATLLVILRVYEKNADVRHPVKTSVLIALCLMICYSAKATALALVLAFAFHELFRSRRIRLFALITGALFTVLFLVYTRYLYDSRQYSDQFFFSWQTYLANIKPYLLSPAVIWGRSPAPLRYLLAGGSLLFAAGGFLRRLRAPSVVELFLIISVTVLILYTEGTSLRYVFPLIPLFLIYAAGGLAWAASRWTQQRRHTGLVALGILLAVAAAINIAAVEHGPIVEGVGKPSFAAVCEFLKRDLPPEGVIASWNPRVFALFTERPSALYPKAINPAEFQRELRRIGISRLVVYSGQLDAAALRNRAAGLPLIYDNGEFAVYRP